MEQEDDRSTARKFAETAHRSSAVRHSSAVGITCKLHGVDPQAYLTDVLTKLVNLWPASRLDELMPWAWAAERAASRRAA